MECPKYISDGQDTKCHAGNEWNEDQHLGNEWDKMAKCGTTCNREQNNILLRRRWCRTNMRQLRKEMRRFLSANRRGTKSGKHQGNNYSNGWVLNAKIGREKEKIVGRYGLGECNERGDRLLQFCQENEFIIKNTYKLLKRRLYTWRAPSDKADRIVRNQIDNILINAKYRNAIKSVKAYPGADVESDHIPLRKIRGEA